MITVTIHDNSHYTVEGHASFDEIGKDIVCAGVSSMALLTTFGVERESDGGIEVVEDDGYLDVYVIYPNVITKAFVASFFYAIKDLIRQYPNHIQLKGVKVL